MEYCCTAYYDYNFYTDVYARYYKIFDAFSYKNKKYRTY